MPTKCFFLEPTGFAEVYLRCYASGSQGACPATPSGFHNARIGIGRCQADLNERGCYEFSLNEWPDKSDWPTHCGCGHEFSASDPFQVFHDVLYRRRETGQFMKLAEAPPGAMWFAPWLGDIPQWCGLDGHALFVRLPDGHDWHVDGRAANCTMPEDNVHKCWCRHGDPREQNLAFSATATCEIIRARKSK